MDNREEEIRVRAYETWERQGRSGRPEDHWLEAERELKTEEAPTEASQDRSEAKLSKQPAIALQSANGLLGHPKPERRAC